jgi:hypothetical protein
MHSAVAKSLDVALNAARHTRGSRFEAAVPLEFWHLRDASSAKCPCLMFARLVV